MDISVFNGFQAAARRSRESSINAIPATYSQSSVFSGEIEPFGLVTLTAATQENMQNGIYAETLATATMGGEVEWIKMDFGSVLPYSGVVIGCDFDYTLQGDWGPNISRNKDIQVSDNNSTWTTIQNTGTLSAGLTTFTLSGSCRYMRFTLESGYVGFIGLTEFYAIPG